MQVFKIEIFKNHFILETEQLFSLLNEPIEIKDHPSASLLKVDEGTIEFQVIFFIFF